jgi:Domain of unknown function (DUF4123)/Inner membrane component of T3SS, cytoplasmic domain
MSTSPRLIVEVRSGALRGTKAIVAPEGKLRVGRTERADFVLERDPELSGVHFELGWDGDTCTLRDLASARGTSLSGAPIEGEVVVPHGGWIKAGDTSFSVYVEARSKLRSEPADPALAARALAALSPRVGSLYAVLDAARDERVLELCRESVDETRSLYEGVKGEALADVAPYLVAFAKGSGLLQRLVHDGWGKSFGVFIESRAPFKAVRRHLRRFLIVAAETTDKRFYFRYYDPRALREILPLLTVRQADEIFADVIDGFLAEGEDGEVASFARPDANAWSSTDAAHS